MGKERPRVSCYDKALGLLGRRSHFRRELEGKLRQRGYPEAEVEETLGRLEGHGYLDDARTARELVEMRLSRGPEGKRRLASELKRRGASQEAVEEALAALPDDDLPAARKAAEAWTRRGGGDPRSLARHLHRKGFSQRAIYTLLDEAGPPESP